MYKENICKNFNHSRSNVIIRHCTDCGESLNSLVMARCNDDKHASQRKDRNKFCTDCGKKLRD